MWISNVSIRKPVITTVVMLALVVFGGLALLLLDTDEFPEVNPPVISVALIYPGASPANVERDLIDPIEEAVAGISGVDRMDSTSTDGVGVLIVTFLFDKDLQEGSQDIRDKISEIRRDLPSEMEEPILTRFNPTDAPIVSLTLSSTALDPGELTRLADPGITSQLRAIPGVADVAIIGGVERELSVELRADALRASGISVMQVAGALQSENLAAPVGRLNGELEERTIRLLGRLKTPAEFEELIVARLGDRVVRLGDLATIHDGTEEARTAALYNGKEAIGIDIKKSSNESTTAVSERIRGEVESLRTTLPDDVELTVVRDAGTRVADSVLDVEKSLIEGAILTVIVVFIFLMSWRSTIITGLALPVSVIASFTMVLAFGFTLNTMSLLGLSLAIGILIDDAIVVRENIVRHMEMGKDHHTAAREGTAEIGLAVAATTFSIVVVFVPIAFMGGIAQQWLGPFALTLAASVMVSLFVSFSLDPMLSSIWADPELEAENRTWLSRLFEPFNHWLERQTERYSRVIHWALDHRITMVVIALASFMGALAMPATGLVGNAFMPLEDRSEFTLVVEAPPGSSMGYTQEKIAAVVAKAQTYSEVVHVYSTVGGAPGQGVGVDEGTVYVKLLPKAERERGQDSIAAEIRDYSKTLGGVNTYIQNAFGPKKQIEVELRGPNLEVLTELAGSTGRLIEAIPGAVDIGLSSKGEKRELEVVMDRDMAGTLGVRLSDVAQSLRAAFAGIEIGDWVDPGGKTREVTLRLSANARKLAEDIETLPIVIYGEGGTQKTIPLSQIAKIESGLGPVQISHLDRDRVIKVGANVEGVPLSAVASKMNAELDTIELPKGYSLSQGGESKDQGEVFGQILVSLGVAIMLMYLILVVQFNSFVVPVAIMASLPLSLIGVMLALYFTNSTLNLMSMIGVVLLMGIVAKNAILLVDFAKHLEEEQGMERKEAIAKAGSVRLRPILMTSFAIIAGMMPVALGGGEGGDFRAPLGRAVIGGVITSTLLTLLVIPTFYEILSDVRDWVLAKLGGKPRASAPGSRQSELEKEST